MNFYLDNHLHRQKLNQVISFLNKTQLQLSKKINIVILLFKIKINIFTLSILWILSVYIRYEGGLKNSYVDVISADDDFWPIRSKHCNTNKNVNCKGDYVKK